MFVSQDQFFDVERGIASGKFHIHTPLIQMTKAEIIRRGLQLEVDFGLTTSCYDPSPGGAPCGRLSAIPTC